MTAKGCKAVERFSPLKFASANATIDSSNATIFLRRWSRQCRTALSNAERADVALLCCGDVLEGSRSSALGFEADVDAQFVAKVSSWLAACSTRAGEAPVAKANLQDTVCQARGRRLHTLDSRDPLSQRLVVLGVVGGKQVEKQDMG